jgi:Holliday junction DNA helicase RuvA
LVPRLGKKNAQKIIIELKSKLGSITDLDLSGNFTASSDLLEALLSMGYTRAESIAAIQKLPSDSGSIENQIRLVLKQMSKK